MAFSFFEEAKWRGVAHWNSKTRDPNYVIKTGHNGIPRRANEEIVIPVSSLHRLTELHLPFVSSDRRAFLNTARFFADVADLDRIDWKILQESGQGCHPG